MNVAPHVLFLLIMTRQHNIIKQNKLLIKDGFVWDQEKARKSLKRITSEFLLHGQWPTLSENNSLIIVYKQWGIKTWLVI